MATVTLDRLGKRYGGGAPAVQDVTFEVAHGEFFVLLGPSGCGKSTTLRMIAGLEAITEGTLAIDGARMNEVPARDRDIAMVFQSYALYPHMSVYDNMAFGLRRRAMPKAEIDRRVRAAAAILGLEPLLGRRPHALSGGQRQRVAVGRAIVRDPKVFLFDEPLSNLDAALRASTRQELIRLHRRLGATMIYVTHDQVEAMTMGDRICIMDHGRVAQIGAPLEVYRRPATTFVAGFLGSPPMNLLPATVADGRVRLGEATLTVPARVPEGPVTLGVRPEDLVPVPEGPLRGEVVAVEPLGAETILSLRLPGVERELMLRAGRSAPAALGERIALAAPDDAIHLFHAVTGRRLT
ncbi:ABC transporter ATP-binding protein [Elioraea sp.]|uniref:ABC transporter ATP-binding protein n=1 Tax=Elioraea sp. TaxID=2185103 RepID=UPI0021DE3C59|nr:sn-glycerol-3-phosphate ABC transporter ATP-binding protein UgpC [Elioraea sp.]GIX11867.1 MAG: ABC transporter ATP-binding protein [Elioraea sp.]